VGSLCASPCTAFSPPVRFAPAALTAVLGTSGSVCGQQGAGGGVYVLLACMLPTCTTPRHVPLSRAGCVRHVSGHPLHHGLHPGHGEGIAQHVATIRHGATGVGALCAQDLYDAFYLGFGTGFSALVLLGVAGTWLYRKTLVSPGRVIARALAVAQKSRRVAGAVGDSVKQGR